MVGEDVSNNTLRQRNGNGIYRAQLQSSNITVQPGDVVGYFVGDSYRKRVRRAEGIVLDQNHNTERVWYYGSTTQLPLAVGPHSCQASIGPNGTLTSFTAAAPLLSVGIGKVMQVR